MTIKDTEKNEPVRSDNGSSHELLEVMAALRTPVTGCPWDLEQDFASIVPYTIEEAYEVADAIARDDAVDLQDELGDLLLQVVYHARMAEERDLFSFHDVVQGITDKMLRRHPHVFGSKEERTNGPVAGSWDRIKQAENDARQTRLSGLPDDKKTLSGRPTEDRPPRPQSRTLGNVPAILPALSRAIKLQNKAAKVGFDWPSLTPVFAKMKEELFELEAAQSQNVSTNATEARGQPEPSAHVVEEFGDLLFVMANVARHMKIDPEGALRDANQKFICRFNAIEDRLADIGKTPSQSDLAEMDALWDAVKEEEKA